MANTTYAALNDFDARMPSYGASTARDTYIQQLLNSAAKLIDAETRCPLLGYEAFSASASEVRYFDDIIREPVAYIDDLLTVTAVTRGDTTITSDYYQLLPLNKGNGPYTAIRLRYDALSASSTAYSEWYDGWGRGRRQLAITGTWGYCTSANRPPEILEATCIQAVRMYERSNLAVKDIINAVVNPFKSLDPYVEELIKEYRRAGRTVLA